MSELKATPGPWDWWDDGQRVRVTDAAEQRQICEVILPSNAHLIASAPNLYEALAWFINDIDGTHTVMLDFDANVEKARAALARARGDVR